MLIDPANNTIFKPVPPVRPPIGCMASVQARVPGNGGSVTPGMENPKAEKTPDVSQVADLADNIQKNLNTLHTVKMNFSVHEASDRLMVTISDEKTGEVIREIPSSEILNLAARLDEMVGLLFDQRG